MGARQAGGAVHGLHCGVRELLVLPMHRPAGQISALACITGPQPPGLALLTSPPQEHLLVTGSYDERARLWDVRQLARPVCAAEVRQLLGPPPAIGGNGQGAVEQPNDRIIN